MMTDAWYNFKGLVATMDKVDVWIAFPMHWFFHKVMLATDGDVFWEDAFQCILFDFVIHLLLKTVATGLVGVA